MKAAETALPGVLTLDADPVEDSRGRFCEIYDAKKLRVIGIDTVFVMDAWSTSRSIGTVRGLHFQAPPCAQAKLVRVARGRVLDVIVDVKNDSPTYGSHVALELDARSLRQIYIPVGFAHGFCTLEPDTEVVYKMSGHYSQAHYGGILWNDPALGIRWPIDQAHARVSEKDSRLPLLKNLGPVFGKAGT